MALDASSSEVYVTKPNPLDLPVSRSIIILATKSVTFKGNIKYVNIISLTPPGNQLVKDTKSKKRKKKKRI